MDDLIEKRDRMVQNVNKKLNDITERYKEKTLEEATKEAEEALKKVHGEPGEPPAAPEPSAPAPAQTTPAGKVRPLVYLHFPIAGFQDAPAWVRPLREALLQIGYQVYVSEIPVEHQYQRDDLPALNGLGKRVVPSVCRMLKIPEAILLPLDTPVMAKAVQDAEAERDIDATIARDLWFLARSSIMLVDLVRENRGVGFGQKILYAKLLDVPVIGIAPLGGGVNPWVQRGVTALLTDNFNAINILPIIRGYAPL